MYIFFWDYRQEEISNYVHKEFVRDQSFIEIVTIIIFIVAKKYSQDNERIKKCGK